MINTKDQEQLFQLISNYLDEDVTCLAIGGTAMMFLNYKTTTKDIDLIFSSEKDRHIFIKAIEQLGYKEKSIKEIYDKKRLKIKNKPLMFTRGDERFDLFVNNIFGFELNINSPNIILRNDFVGEKELIIKILSKEYLILLKSITGREKDFEDIETILELEKEIDWEVITSEAIKQKKNNEWILIDLEEMMQKLKHKIFIPSKFFEKLYKAEQ